VPAGPAALGGEPGTGQADGDDDDPHPGVVGAQGCIGVRREDLGADGEHDAAADLGRCDEHAAGQALLVFAGMGDGSDVQGRVDRCVAESDAGLRHRHEHDGVDLADGQLEPQVADRLEHYLDPTYVPALTS
jgi:hypothetical protein